VLFAAAAASQLVPLPIAWLGRISPRSLDVLSQLTLGTAPPGAAKHALSLAPAQTAVGLVLFAAFALFAFGGARVLAIGGGRKIAEALSLLGALVAVVGIVQQPLFAGKIYGFWAPAMTGSPFGPFVNKNHFAGWMLMILPVTLGLLCGGVARGMRGIKPGGRNRLVWFSSGDANRVVLVAAGAGVMALSLVLTMSRSGMAAMTLALALTAIVALRKQRTGTRRTLVAAYVVVLLIGTFGWAGIDVVASRFSNTEWSEFNGRRGAWGDARSVISHFPLTGTGLATYGTAMLFYQTHDLEHHYAEAHNDYLQLTAEGGLLLIVPALLCLVAFGIAVRRRFHQAQSSDTYWLRVGAVTGIVAVALQETVEFSLQMPGNAAAFALLCAFALHAPRPDTSPDSASDSASTLLRHPRGLPSMNVCQTCGSPNVQRSRSKNSWEGFRKQLTTKRLFRCRACGWRGWGVDTGPSFSDADRRLAERALAPEPLNLTGTELDRRRARDLDVESLDR
jgi:O-antigen ligase